MVRSNIAINGWRALKREYKNIGRDLKRTWYGETPYTYAFRTQEARAAFDQVGDIQKFKEQGGFGPGTWSWNRIGLIGGTAYVGMDATYRALSGGSLYRNKTGESDIVGIPLI
jgi:hypothetical protein